MDDRGEFTWRGKKGLAVTGTIGVLDLAAQRGLFELGMAPLRKFRMRSAAACASPIFSSAVVSGRDCLKGGQSPVKQVLDGVRLPGGDLGLDDTLVFGGQGTGYKSECYKGRHHTR